MTEQEMREALAKGQDAMAEMVAQTDLDYGHPLVKMAEQMSQKMLELLIGWIHQVGLADDKQVSGDGAKVMLIATTSLALSASLVARISKESTSKEQVDKLLKLARKINQEGERD